MDTTLPGIKYLQATSGINWSTGKFKLYVIDLMEAGPVSGSRSIINPDVTPVLQKTSIHTPPLGTPYYYHVEFSTSEEHGLSVGDNIAFPAMEGEPLTFGAEVVFHGVGDTVRYKTQTTPYRARCVEVGTSDTTTEAAWPTTPGSYVSQAGVSTSWWIMESIAYNYNGVRTRNWVVSDIISPTTFQITIDGKHNPTNTGYVLPLDNLTYLTDFGGGDLTHHAVSDALTGKSVVVDELSTYLTCSAAQFSTLPEDLERGKLWCLVKVANAHADDDLPYDEQVLMAMWDYKLPTLSSSVSLPTRLVTI